MLSPFFLKKQDIWAGQPSAPKTPVRTPHFHQYTAVRARRPRSRAVCLFVCVIAGVLSKKIAKENAAKSVCRAHSAGKAPPEKNASGETIACWLYSHIWEDVESPRAAPESGM